jgi:8-oxo-dGTP diphosphatase
MKVTCGIVLNKGKILAVQRGFSKQHGGKWEFPGGKVKPDESYENCIRRELQEELSITIHIYNQLPTVFYGYPEFTIELIPFVCEISEGEVVLNEHIALKWCGFDDLEKLDFSNADKRIVEYIKKAGRVPALGNSDKN